MEAREDSVFRKPEEPWPKTPAPYDRNDEQPTKVHKVSFENPDTPIDQQA